MSQTPDRDAILNALRVVVDPDLRRDIVSLGFVKDVVAADGAVSLTIELTTPACPVKDQMRDQAVAAVQALPGVSKATVQMTARVRSASAPETGKTPVPGVKNVIAVGAGKGGVGKTTVAVNLAIALAKCGSRVGILDGDIYGPNVPMMLGIKTQLTTNGKQIVPAEKYGVQVISIGFMTDDDAPVIWRGPMLHGAIQQFFKEVAWNDLDYLIVDMPPGTGDVAISIGQLLPRAEAVIVTTPQPAAQQVAVRAAVMAQKTGMRVLGVVENMAWLVGTGQELFGTGGGDALAAEIDAPVLARIPFDPALREASDAGRPVLEAAPQAEVSAAIRDLAEAVQARRAGAIRKQLTVL